MNLTETNQKINMISDHFVLSNNSFKNHLNAKIFNIFNKIFKASRYHATLNV